MNDLTKEQLEELVQSLAWNDGYGCYTRAGFEKIIWKYIESKARWIIFFDIDNMHDLNDRHGYAGVNAIIKKSLAMRETDFMAGQWFSGVNSLSASPMMTRCVTSRTLWNSACAWRRSSRKTVLPPHLRSLPLDRAICLRTWHLPWSSSRMPNGKTTAARSASFQEIPDEREAKSFHGHAREDHALLL